MQGRAALDAGLALLAQIVAIPCSSVVSLFFTLLWDSNLGFWSFNEINQLSEGHSASGSSGREAQCEAVRRQGKIKRREEEEHNFGWMCPAM